MAYLDVTDASFQTEVLDRSMTTPVVIDLWAPWCGPCKTLGPIIERIVDETGGQVVLAKVDVDQNPAVSQAFRVQSIPAVYAVVDGQIIDGFMGAQPEAEVRDFVARLVPTSEQVTIAELIESGDEDGMRLALAVDPANEDLIVALAELSIARGEFDGALDLLQRIPESERTRPLAAACRLQGAPDDDHDATLTDLLAQVKTDDEARQRYVDILELMGPDDARTASYRKQLTARLY